MLTSVLRAAPGIHWLAGLSSYGGQKLNQTDRDSAMYILDIQDEKFTWVRCAFRSCLRASLADTMLAHSRRCSSATTYPASLAVALGINALCRVAR